MEVKLFVKLIIPDNVAITAMNALKDLGYDVDLKREDYYKFETNDKDFENKITKVDLLVNANKHRASTKMSEGTKILVKSIDNDCASLLDALKNRLGFDIKSIEKGVLWTINKDKNTAKKIAEELLVNPHYQKFEVL